MEQIKESIIAGVGGAAAGFVATKGLALCGLTVTNPAMGALYGATLFLFPSIEDMGVIIKKDPDSNFGTITKIALIALARSAIAIAVTALCGSYITLGNALILTFATAGIFIITAIAVQKTVQAIRGTSTAQA